MRTRGVGLTIPKYSRTSFMDGPNKMEKITNLQKTLHIPGVERATTRRRRDSNTGRAECETDALTTALRSFADVEKNLTAI